MTTVSVENNMRKRLFIGLLALSLIFLLLIFVAAWWLVSQRELLANKVILTAVTGFIIMVFFVLFLGFAALVWSLWRSRTIPSLQSVISTATNILFPLAIHLGKWVGLEEERIKNSFIQVSNHLVKTKVRTKPLEHILILAPHCLQWIHCPYKITIDINNCRECGKCQVFELRERARRYGTKLMIVTGGTFARKVIKDIKPQAVVAIACERDLTSGIQDIAGIPVIGIINERPEGPCANTRVDLNKVDEAIRYFQKGGND